MVLVYNINMSTLNRDHLYSHMKVGFVYRRDDLLSFSSNLDRDLNILVEAKNSKNQQQVYITSQSILALDYYHRLMRRLLKVFLISPFSCIHEMITINWV